MTSQQDHPLTLTFRCPVELEGLLPSPVPAALGLPDWFKAMPPQAFNEVNDRVGRTQAVVDGDRTTCAQADHDEVRDRGAGREVEVRGGR